MSMTRGSLLTVAGLVCVSCAAGEAAAQTVQPLLNVRARYETFDVDWSPRSSAALTVRARPGIALHLDRLTAVVEAEATAGVAGAYNDGFNGLNDRPVIPDPDNIELNRIQLQYRDRGNIVTVGRQAIDVADQRFIGTANFRQNQRTFDAVRVQWGLTPRLTADVGYAWNVRTSNGRKGTGGRPSDIPGTNVFAVVNRTTPIGTIGVFLYLIDMNLAAVESNRLQNRNYGVRFTGVRPLTADLKLGYVASFAIQRDFHRNPNRYEAQYGLIETSLTHHALTGTAGYEVLGASDGRPFTSFQTPDNSAIRYQGFAGRFTTTPPDGVRDLYATVASTWKIKGPVSDIGAGVTVHRLNSDRIVRRYGDEFDALVTMRIRGVTVAARYAAYRAQQPNGDMDRLWLSADWEL